MLSDPHRRVAAILKKLIDLTVRAIWKPILERILRDRVQRDFFKISSPQLVSSWTDKAFDLCLKFGEPV